MLGSSGSAALFILWNGFRLWKPFLLNSKCLGMINYFPTVHAILGYMHMESFQFLSFARMYLDGIKESYPSTLSRNDSNLQNAHHEGCRR